MSTISEDAKRYAVQALAYGGPAGNEPGRKTGTVGKSVVLSSASSSREQTPAPAAPVQLRTFPPKRRV